MSTVPPTSLVAEHVPDIVELLNTAIPMLLIIRLLATKPWPLVLIARAQPFSIRTRLLFLLFLPLLLVCLNASLILQFAAFVDPMVFATIPTAMNTSTTRDMPTVSGRQ